MGVAKAVSWLEHKGSLASLDGPTSDGSASPSSPPSRLALFGESFKACKQSLSNQVAIFQLQTKVQARTTFFGNYNP